MTGETLPSGGAPLPCPPMSLAILDYDAGNLTSVQRALAHLGVSAEVSPDPAVIDRAARVIFPGVGAAGQCMGTLRARRLDEALRRVVASGRPVLVICVGMQLLATRGLEFGVTAGLDWIPGDVAPIKPSDPTLKIPHMGWNTLSLRRPHALLADMATGAEGLHAYFVHSFHLACRNTDDIVATTDYGGVITAIVGRDNYVGTQFHPEKSQRLGLRLLGNFLTWRP